MAQKTPDFVPLGYGPWPETDMPLEDNPGGGYKDGYNGRYPGGSYGENPSDMWLDAMVYPERPYPASSADADRLDHASRYLGIGAGNITGRKNGTEK